MNQVIKSYLGLFLILFMGACCFGIFGVFLQVMQAQDFHANAVSEIEESDYNREVLAACLKEAGEKEYDMEIVLYADGEEPVTVKKAEDIPQGQMLYQTARVSMNFKIDMAFFQIGQTKTLCAYTG